MHEIPDNIIRKISSLLTSNKDKAVLKSLNKDTRRAMDGVNDLPTGPRSYLTGTRGRFQKRYDEWEKYYEEEKDDFHKRLDLTSYRMIEITRMLFAPELIANAKEAYTKENLIRFFLTDWKKNQRKSIERDLYIRSKRRVRSWSKSGPFNKKYASLLKVLRRFKGKPTKDEERDLGTFLMDAIIKESLLFHDKDIKDSVPRGT